MLITTWNCILHEVGCKLGSRHPTSRISLSKNYRDAGGPGDEEHLAVASILAHASRLGNVPALIINSKGKVLVDSSEKPIEIDKDVYLTVENTHKGGR